MTRYLIKRTTRDGEVLYLSTIYSTNKFDWTRRTAFAHRFISVPLANKWFNKLVVMYKDKVELVEE